MRQCVSPYFACNDIIRKDYKSRQWFPYLRFATSLLAALATACVDLRERVRLAIVFKFSSVAALVRPPVASSSTSCKHSRVPSVV